MEKDENFPLSITGDKLDNSVIVACQDVIPRGYLFSVLCNGIIRNLQVLQTQVTVSYSTVSVHQPLTLTDMFIIISQLILFLS